MATIGRRAGRNLHQTPFDVASKFGDEKIPIVRMSTFHGSWESKGGRKAVGTADDIPPE